MNNQHVEQKTILSQAYFNLVSLIFYDWLLYGFVSQYIWGCTPHFLINRYRTLIGNKHLEVGVGTGYLLDKLNPSNMAIDLMDLNDNCLQKTCKRLGRYNPNIFKQNILEPCNGHVDQYQSISLNYVLHCLPGDFNHKTVAFGHLKELLLKDGVLFGATVIGRNNKGHLAAQLFMRLLNVIGLFNNTNDEPEKLRTGLGQYFSYVDVDVYSSTAVFFATDDKHIYDQKRKELSNYSSI